MRKNTEKEFWAKVEKSKTCWLWLASKCQGYGHFKFENKLHKAHRVAFKLTHQLPDFNFGYLDHICRIRHCVNPDHLEVVTHQTNVLRGIGPTAINKRKTHCKNGHKYTEENTIIRSNKNRRCKICTQKRNRDQMRIIRNTTQPYNGDKTHCKRGHEFIASNTYFMKQGGRCCIQCRNERVKAWKMNHKIMSPLPQK